MSFTALAMPCNQEQFEKDLEPTLKRWGVDYTDVKNWIECNHISNNRLGVKGEVGTLLKTYCEDFDRTLIPYNPAKFLDSLFPDKWCVRANGIDFTTVLKDLNNPIRFSLNVGGLPFERWFAYDTELRWIMKSELKNYTEVTLEELVYHYEQKDMKKEEPKWEDRTRGGLEFHIYEEFEDTIWGRVKKEGQWYSCMWNLKGAINIGLVNNFDLIPFNPRIAELKARKEELEAELEGINKELNN